MTRVGIHEAKIHFSQLVDRTLAGEEIIITRSGEPIMRFVPEQPSGRPHIDFAARIRAIALNQFAGHVPCGAAG